MMDQKNNNDKKKNVFLLSKLQPVFSRELLSKSHLDREAKGHQQLCMCGTFAVMIYSKCKDGNQLVFLVRICPKRKSLYAKLCSHGYFVRNIPALSNLVKLYFLCASANTCHDKLQELRTTKNVKKMYFIFVALFRCNKPN